MTRRRKKFHAFHERQLYAFNCLFVSWLFSFFECKFLKKTWRTYQKHQSNQPYVARGVKISDKNIIFTALSSLGVSLHQQNICICHHQSQSEIQLIFVTGCPELFHLAGFLNESL